MHERAAGRAADPSPPPARPARIVEVAALAGVSRTTASDALRASPRVAERTRLRVEAAARELGYRVNIAARSLRSAETGAIGLHLPEPMWRIAYYMEIAFGVLEACAAEGYDVTLITAVRYGEGAPPPRVDGLILADPLLDDPVAASLLASGLPLVSMEHAPHEAACVVLSADHEAAAREVLELLAHGGGRRCGMLASPAVTDWGRRVQEVYRAWCSERGAPARLVDRPFGTASAQWREAAAAMLDDGVDALLCGSVAAALASAEVIESRGLALGRDVVLAGMVDAPELAERRVPITAVDLRPREAGIRCVRELVGAIRGSRPRSAVVPFEIEVRRRASTGG